MRCHEARAFDTPYLDSELDSRTSLEIDRHLTDCAGCARYFEAQRKLDQRVDEVLRGELAKDLQLWSVIESAIAETAKPRPIRRWWSKPTVIAFAAALVLAFMLFARPKTPANPLVTAVAADHQKYLDGRMPPQFGEEPPSGLLASTGDRLDLSAFFKLPDRGRFTPAGKRLCKIDGVPIAWMVGSSAGTQVSLVVMKESELERFPALRRRFEEGHRIACFDAGDFEFGARLVAGHVVAAIGDLPRKEIEALLASVETR